MEKINIGELFWWSETQRVWIVLKLKNGIQYEIDGRFLREGIYSVIFENDKKTGREVIDNYHFLPKVENNELEGAWISIPKKFWGHWDLKFSRPDILEGLMENYPEKTPGKYMKEYIEWIPDIR